jgi:hypothetical protein
VKARRRSEIIANYSLEDDPFQVGEQAEVLVNRLFLCTDTDVQSVENQNLKMVDSVVI